MAKLKKTPLIKCRHCGSYLERKRRPNGTIEAIATFKNRKYCDRICAAEGMVKAGSGVNRYYKRLKSYPREKCEKCGVTNKEHIQKRGCNLSIHHIDGDPSNNDPSNLKVMCASCHWKLHHRNGDFPRNATLKDEVGNIYGKLSVVELHPSSTERKMGMWVCKCSCGNTVVVRGSSLRYGNTRSCGCIRVIGIRKKPEAQNGSEKAE